MTLTNVWEHPSFDYSRAPLLVQRLPPDTSDQNVVAFCAATEAYVAAHPEPYVWVVDASALVHATSRQRRLMSEHGMRVAEVNRKYCLGIALVLTGPVARALVSAVYFLTPPTCPYRTFAAWDQAEKWARERLAEKGLSAP